MTTTDVLREEAVVLRANPQHPPKSHIPATTRQGMTSPTQPHQGETSLTISASEIHENDVLCGRGCEISSHPGNIFFRRLVESKNRAYLLCDSKKDKTNIAWSVVDDVHARVPRGRFLIKNETPGRGGRRRRKRPHDETWYEVDDKKAREKAAQALREKAPKIREELKLQKSREDQRGHNGGIANQANKGNREMRIGIAQPQGLVYPEGGGDNKRRKMTDLCLPSPGSKPFVTPPVEGTHTAHPKALDASAATGASSMFNERYTSNFDTDQIESRHHCPSQGSFVPDTSQLTQMGPFQQDQQGKTPDARYQGVAAAADTIPHSPIRFKQIFHQPQPTTSMHQRYSNEMASQPWHHPSSASANTTAAQEQPTQGGSLTSVGYCNSGTAGDTGTHTECGSFGRPSSFDFETTSVCEGGSFPPTLGQHPGHSFENGDAKAASFAEPPCLNRQLSKTILTRSSFSGDFNIGFSMAPFSPKVPLDSGTGNE